MQVFPEIWEPDTFWKGELKLCFSSGVYLTDRYTYTSVISWVLLYTARFITRKCYFESAVKDKMLLLKKKNL